LIFKDALSDLQITPKGKVDEETKAQLQARACMGLSEWLSLTMSGDLAVLVSLAT
jgi:hypothetical protein